MCREGVNLTQFKLAINHLREEVELTKRGVSQWQLLLNSGYLNEIKELLKETENLLADSANKLQSALSKASELATSNIDEVEITPL